MMSDYFGSNFQTIAKELVCTKSLGFCDFIPVWSLDGVIIINVYDKQLIDVLNDLPENNQYRAANINKSIEDFKFSLISFNYGESF